MGEKHIKALIISDVHSNIDALEAVYEKEKDSDFIYCAGDLTDYGFFPGEVISWFQAHNVVAISGNHDREIVRLSKVDPKPVDKADADNFTRYNLACMSQQDLSYLASLPLDVSFELDGILYYMKHSYDEERLHTVAESLIHYQSVALFEKIWAEKMNDFPHAPKRRIIYGHTHRCCVHMVRGETIWMNPGSVSYRLGGDTQAKGADYLVIENGEVFLRHLDYPTDHLLKMVESSGFIDSQKDIGRGFYSV